MFDGNHRSRRQVNLGTKNRRRGRAGTRTSTTAIATGSTEGGRESLLEQTRILREQRRRQQLEERSSTKIQKVYRGWKGRKYVANQLLEHLWQQQRRETTTDLNNNHKNNLHHESFLLSLRLSAHLLHALDCGKASSSSSSLTTVENWLLEHATHIQQTDGTGLPYALSYRIVQAALTRLRPLQKSADVSEEKVQAYFTIVHYYLPQPAATNLSLWKTLGGASGFLLLLQSTQECLWWYFAAPPKDDYTSMVQTLWSWSRQGVQEAGHHDSSLQRHVEALLGAIAMGHHTGIAKDPDWMGHQADKPAQSLPYETHFEALVQVITTASNSSDSNAITKAYSRVLGQILHGRWHIVLSNVLDFQKTQHALPSRPLLQFLQFVLTHHKDLAMLTSLVVKGEDVRSIVLLQQQQQNQHKDVADKAQDEDDKALEEEMEEQMAPPPQQPSPAPDGVAPMAEANNESSSSVNSTSKKHKSAATRRFTKQDLQTMPQLERFYQDEMQRQCNQTMSTLLEQAKSSNPAAKAYAQSMVEMAVQIGTPSVWISWGNILLKPKKDEDDETMVDTAEQSYREAYFQLLNRLLQGSTGLRPRMSAGSPFLSQLAFAGNGELIERLWQAVLAHAGDERSASSQDLLTCSMLTVFCDVFAQYLIALSDEKFLQQYTIVGASPGAPPKTLLAEELIGYLRTLLHEVYWTKPVIADDIKIATSISAANDAEDTLRAMRARFLLSGTKLWVSLYERWCRLVRSKPFCDESKWWFPHLATQEGERAVVHESAVRQARRAANNPNNGVVEMDIDSSDEDDDEDLEENDRDQRSGNQSQEMTNADVENDALANAFRDPKMARVLTCIPQALPFDRRVRLFDTLLTADKLKTQDENAEMRAAMIQMMQGIENPSFAAGRERVEIRRDRLYDDSMRQLNKLGPKLKRKVQVSFVNQHGTAEAGIDGGGVFKVSL